MLFKKTGGDDDMKDESMLPAEINADTTVRYKVIKTAMCAL